MLTQHYARSYALMFNPKPLNWDTLLRIVSFKLHVTLTLSKLEEPN